MFTIEQNFEERSMMNFLLGFLIEYLRDLPALLQCIQRRFHIIPNLLS